MWVPGKERLGGSPGPPPGVWYWSTLGKPSISRRAPDHHVPRHMVTDPCGGLSELVESDVGDPRTMEDCGPWGRCPLQSGHPPERPGPVPSRLHGSSWVTETPYLEEFPCRTPWCRGPTFPGPRKGFCLIEEGSYDRSFVRMRSKQNKINRLNYKIQMSLWFVYHLQGVWGRGTGSKRILMEESNPTSAHCQFLGYN